MRPDGNVNRIMKKKGKVMNAENRKRRVVSRLAAMILAMAVIVTCFPGFSTASSAASASGTVATGGGNLNVRSGPSMDYGVISWLKDGTKVTVKSKTGNWYKIEYVSGKTGYVYKTYLTVSGSVSSEAAPSGSVSSSTSSTGTSYPVTAKVTNGGVSLKLRQSATTASAILAQIPRGGSIKITGQYNSNWYKAYYDGKSGYVYASYIIMPGGSGNTSSSNTSSGSSASSSAGSSSSSGSSSSNKTTSSKYKYAKIDLDVPMYSQTDARWANLRLGNTLYTIRQCGCVVCGLAQIESYRKGQQITPTKMLKTLSFDSNGCVYWPAGSKAYWSSDYEVQIYKQLSNNNPVLVGAFTPSGKQHWVVATGYNTNSNTLSISNITINDCSGRYSTLGEFLSQYSRFYKIVYME